MGQGGPDSNNNEEAFYTLYPHYQIKFSVMIRILGWGLSSLQRYSRRILQLQPTWLASQRDFVLNSKVKELLFTEFIDDCR